MLFCEKLRSLIEERGMTQKKLATELNIAPSTIGGYVQGISEPDFQTLKRFACYFHVSTDYLLDLPLENAQTSLENELLRTFRSMTDEQQILFIEQGKVFVKANFLKEVAKSS